MAKLLVERQDAVTVLTLNRPEVHNNVDDETAVLLADRKAARTTLGLSLQDGLDLEVELCHSQALALKAVAGMQRFVDGSRPEPPRPVSAS